MVKFYPKKKTLGFQIKFPEAESVVLVGDFNEWNESANQMRKNKDGTWRAELKVPEGKHQFRYFVNGMYWENDDECPSVPNDFGTVNSVVNVKFD